MSHTKCAPRGSPSGVPLLLSTNVSTTIHSTPTSCANERVYLYAISTTSDVGVIRIDIISGDGKHELLHRGVLHACPVDSPTLIVGGVTLSGGSSILGTMEQGQAAVHGFYICDERADTRGQRSQSVHFATVEEQSVSAALPVTFVSTSHLDNSACIARLPMADAGTTKLIVLVDKDAHADTTQGHCEIRGKLALPGGGTKLVLQSIGDSAALVSSGKAWFVSNTGAHVF